VEEQLGNLMETQPVWSQFLTGIASIRIQPGSIDLAFEKIDSPFDRVLNREILDIQNAHEDLEERVSIENSSNQQ
jgi:hypothetical protein